VQEDARPEGTDALGGLGALAGAGSSQLRVSAAMRARDVSRPRAEHLAAAAARAAPQQSPAKRP
jgi:hypothetical protein